MGGLDMTESIETPTMPRVPVPVMLDEAGIREWFHVTPSMATFLMRQMPRRIVPHGKRKVFVWTADLLDYLERNSHVA
jgi:hypothetical protein